MAERHRSALLVRHFLRSLQNDHRWISRSCRSRT